MFKKYPFFIVLISIFLTFSHCTEKVVTRQSGFFAYYTIYGEKDAITGPFADVLINIDSMKQIVFCRETGYLPFLVTKRGKSNFDELIPRSDDGTAERLDKNNISSYVRIIDQSSDQILIHWRYMPDLNIVGFTGVVHEYFFVKPDGRIKRQIKQGSFDLVDFNDPENRIIQDLKIIDDKLEVISIKKAQLSKNDIAAIESNPVKTKSVIQPGYWWKFDEGLKNHPYSERKTTMVNVLYKDSETSVNGAFMTTPCSISGNKALWKKGVSGTALAFDGYHSRVSVQAPHILPEEIYSWSMEAWVALGAYPWLWGSVFELTENDHGIRFGISDLGQVGFTYKDTQTEFEIISELQIPLYQWTQVGVVYDKEKKEVRLYIDGKQVAHKRFDIVQFLIPETVISIGLNKSPLLTSEHVSRDYPPDIRTPEGNQPMIYGIEGLIDELKIYDVALDDDQFRQAYQILKSSEKLLENPDLEKRMLPGEVDGQNSSKFGAYYTNLNYHDLWDNLWRSSDYPDIVVRFDELPTSVVYWRGTNYGPGWVTENNIWMSDQSCEIYHEYGCAEHMADKQNRYSHVRIIENHDARILVHWRYASVDILYNFENEHIWADEYHYIYPDGTAIRYVTYHDEPTGWQDVQFFASAGSTPEEQINLQALTVANLDGETYKMDWRDGIPENELNDALISVVNFKSEYKVIVIYPEEIEGIGAWGERERATPETHFAGPWNHWPVSQMPNDGRYAMRTDRLTSSALGGGNPADYAIYGFTNKDISELVPLGRFWNRPPEITIKKGAHGVQFKMSEKAYQIEVTEPVVDLEIKASPESPLFNPAFVFKNWNKHSGEILIDGKVIATGKDCRIGSRHTSEGIDLIIWIRMNREETVSLTFKK